MLSRRDLARTARAALARSRAVALVGPRQSAPATEAVPRWVALPLS
jgi:hypothetical protein